MLEGPDEIRYLKMLDGIFLSIESSASLCGEWLGGSSLQNRAGLSVWQPQINDLQFRQQLVGRMRSAALAYATFPPSRAKQTKTCLRTWLALSPPHTS